jgi:outer membrane protein insertion porin family
MTATDAVSPAENPLRRKARRILRRVLFVLLGAGVLLVILHVPPVKSGVGAVLVRLLTRLADAEVTLQNLDYRLWAGEASAEGLSVRRQDFAVSCPRVMLRMDTSGLRVEITDARVIVVETTDTSPPVASSRPWAVVGRFAAIVISRAAMELRDRDGKAWLRADGIDATMERNDFRSHGTARVARVDVAPPGGGAPVTGVRAEASIEVDLSSEVLRLVQGRVTVGATNLQATGSISQLGPTIASAEAKGTIGAPILKRIAPAIGDENTLDVRLSLAHETTGARGSFAIDTPALTIAGVGPWSGGLRGRLQGQRILLDTVDLRGYGANVAAKGAAFVREGPGTLDVQVRGLDVAAFLAGVTTPPPPIAARADLDLRLEIGNWNAETLAGAGELSLRATGGPGWPIAGRSRFSLSSSRVTFAARELGVSTARLGVDGALTFPADLAVSYTARLPDVGELPALLAHAGVEPPALALEGAVEIAGQLTGRLPEWEITARAAGRGVAVEGVDLDLDSTLSLTKDGVRIESLVAHGPDGHVEATGLVPFNDGQWAVDAEVAGVRLTDALSRHGIPVEAAVDGRLRIDGPAAQPHGRFTLESNAAIGSRDGTPGPPAHLRASGNVSWKGLVVEQALAELAGGSVQASGSWDWRDASLAGHLAAEGVALHDTSWLPLAHGGGTATLSVDVSASGRLQALSGRASIALTGNTIHGQALPDVTLEATADGREAAVAGRIGGRPFVTGRLPFVDNWPLHLDVDLAALPLTEALAALPPLSELNPSIAVDGSLSVDLPAASPRDVRYAARANRVYASLQREWRAGPFSVQGDLQGLDVEGLMVQVEGGRLQIDGHVAFDAASHGAPLTLRGDVPLSAAADFLPDATLEGTAGFDVRVSGHLRDPDVTGTVGLTAGPGRIGPIGWTEARLSGEIAGGALRLDTARVALMGGAVSAAGTLPFGGRGEDRVHDVKIDVTGIDLGTVLQTKEPDASAVVDFSARVSARRPALDAITSEGRLTRLDVSVGAMSVGLESPVSLRLQDGMLTHSTMRLHGPGGDALGIDARAQFAGDSPRLQLGVSGQLNLAAAQLLTAGAVRADGLVRLDLMLERAPDGLTLTGEAQVEGKRVLVREPPFVFNDLRGTLRATGRSVELVGVQANVGDGRLTAGGHVTLASLDAPSVDLNVQFEGVPVRYPEGLRSHASGKVRLSGEAGKFRLEGDVIARRAVFERSTNRTSASLDQVGRELDALDARGSALQKVELAVGIRLEDGLRVENDQARLVVDGAVMVGGDLLTPEIRGSLVLREGGTVQLARASLRIVQGRIELAGFPERPPELDIMGRTQVTGVLIEAGLAGPLDNYSLSLSSPNRSDLTQGDLATLILTGRTASAAVSEGGAIVAEELAATLGEALDERMGGAVFIDVSRDEDLIVQDTNPSQRFNIGVPIGTRFFVIYSQALDRNAPRWIVELRPGGEFRVRFISDSDGSEAVQVGHRFSFNVWSRRTAVRRADDLISRIGQVRVEGVTPAEEAELRRRLKLEPGKPFDYFRAEESARALRESLVGRGYRAAAVEFADREAGPGRVDVIYDVRQGPRLEIDWRGDRPGKAARKRVEESWEGDLPIEETAGRLADGVRRTLQADRYYTARVTASVTRTDAASHVVFDVQRGPRGRRVDLRFEGNRSASLEVLRAALPPSDTEAFFALLEEAGTTKLTSAIRLAYAREGFLEAAAGAPRHEFDAATGVLNVTIPVDEGDRARVAALDLPEYARAPDNGAPADLQLEVGQPFSVSAYIDDRGRLASWYREQGYSDARVAGILEPADGGLAVRFRVDPGERMHVGDVRFAREGHTRPSVVDNALTLGPGDLVRPAELARSRQRLSETGVFRSIDIRPEPSGAGTRDLMVDLVPQDDLTLEYNVRYTTRGSGGVGDATSSATDDEIQLGAAIEVSNPLGLGHKYRVYGLVGGERAVLGSTFDAAYFFGRHWRTQVFLFDDQDRLAEIPRLLGRVRGATFQQTKRWRDALGDRRWHDRLRMQWGYTFKHIRYSDPETGQVVAGERAGLIHSLVGDSRDSLTNPRRGFFWSVGTELALETLGSEVDYVKLFGQFYYYVPVGAHVVWAQGYRLGAAPGDDPLLLLDGRFQAGGATSVRAFEENELGPKTTLDEPIGGQSVVIFNQELRFPLFKRLWAGVFYDAGNVFALASDLRLDALRQAAGAGLRFMLPFGPVRLEHAWVLDPRAGETRSRWVFSLGHAF